MGRERAEVEWFDILFDLVFAVAVSFWAERVSRDPRLSTYFVSLIYLLPVFWIWLGQAIFAVRFGEDSPLHQVLALIQVIGVGVMSIELLSEAGPGVAFALGYIAARVGLLLLYGVVCWREPAARSVGVLYVWGFGLGAAIWASSLLAPPAWRPWEWAVGLVTDLAVPWIGRPALRQSPLPSQRLPARMGTFTSLLLGVSVEGIVRGFAEKGWSTWTVSVALSSLVAIIALWWIYAARINQSSLEKQMGAGQPYLYSHIAIVLGAGTSSVGIRVVQADRSTEDAARGLALLAAGVVFWIIGMILIRQVVLKHRDRHWYVPFFAAAVVLPVVAIRGAAHPPAALGAVVALLLVLAVTELRHGRAHPARQHRF